MDPDSSLAPAGKGDHVVEPGEGMSSIADETGHFWETLWNHPDNAEIKAKRENPEILLPGDRVTVPPLRPKQVARPTGRVHSFRRRGVPVRIGFEIRDLSGRICARKRYELFVDPRTYTGTTDDRGRLLEWVEPTARTGRLTIWLDEPDRPESIVWEIRIGQVHPIRSVTGVKSRLHNLGYECGAVDGTWDDRAREALRQFQRRHGLEATGDVDDATRSRLVEEHGS